MNLKDYLNKINNDEEKSTALKAAAKEGREKEFLAAEGVELPEQAPRYPLRLQLRKAHHH